MEITPITVSHHCLYSERSGMFSRITECVLDGWSPCFRTHLEPFWEADPFLIGTSSASVIKEEAQINPTGAIPRFQVQIQNPQFHEGVTFGTQNGPTLCWMLCCQPLKFLNVFEQGNHIFIVHCVLHIMHLTLAEAVVMSFSLRWNWWFTNSLYHVKLGLHVERES